MAENLLDLELATPGLSVATPDIAAADPGAHLAVVPEDYPPGGMPQPGLVGGGALDMGTLWEDYKSAWAGTSCARRASGAGDA